jgi:hypothetical protein
MIKAWIKQKLQKRRTKVYNYCLHNICKYHPITDDLIIGFIKIIKSDDDYSRNASIYIDPITRDYLLEGWELDRRLISTKHNQDKGYSGVAYQYKDQFHPLITTEFELANYEGIEPVNPYMPYHLTTATIIV